MSRIEEIQEEIRAIRKYNEERPKRGTMDEALAILKEYIDARIAFIADDTVWRSQRASERLWEKFVEAFPEMLADLLKKVMEG